MLIGSEMREDGRLWTLTSSPTFLNAISSSTRNDCLRVIPQAKKKKKEKGKKRFEKRKRKKKIRKKKERNKKKFMEGRMKWN